MIYINEGGYPPPFFKIIVSEWFWIPRGCLQSSFVLQPALESMRVVYVETSNKEKLQD